MQVKNKLTKEELNIIASLLRGKRIALAQRAGVSIWTVNNTFQNLYQNELVLKVAKEMVKEQMQESNPDVEELRQLITAQ